MILSKFDDARILSVDYRYESERDRLVELLNKRGVYPRFFIEGRGEELARNLYNQISCDAPPTWKDGRPSYNQFRAIKSIIEETKKAGGNNVLFMEDDLVFTLYFDDIVDIIEIPDDWDMIYYGANHTKHKTQGAGPHLIRVFGSTCMHCVGINHTIFDAILSLPCDRTMDWNIANRLHESYHCYAIYPSVALQKPGYSHLWRQHVDYSELWGNKGVYTE